MPPVISIVGKSDSGKTTLLEGLLAELKRRGYRVAVIKHSGRQLELDTANKDTWRFNRAGSELAAISSAGNLTIFQKTAPESSLEELLPAIGGDHDLILTEGFKQSGYPKIEVHRREQGSDLVSKHGQLLAVVTDEPLDTKAPQFSRDDTAGIADLIEKAVPDRPNEDLELFVNGRRLPTDAAFNDMLIRTLLAMTAGTGGNGIRTMRINMRRKP